MALPVTELSISAVRQALLETKTDLFGLCTSTKINKWSRFKPVIGDAPEGTDGMFGLNPLTNWSYTPAITEARMGDFAGYEHDKDVAGPTIYCNLTDVDVPDVVVPTPYEGEPSSYGEFTIKCNQLGGSDFNILPSDIGIDTWRIGLILHLGSDTWWKTGELVSSIGPSGAVIGFSTILQDIYGAVEDFPQNSIGEWTWILFITNSNSDGNWNLMGDVDPDQFYLLPGLSGEISGSNTIISDGIFYLDPYLISTPDAEGSELTGPLIWEYSDVAPKSLYLWTNQVNSKGPGIPQEARFAPAFAFIGQWTGHWNYQGYNQFGDPIDMTDWENGTRVDIWPLTDNNSSVIEDEVWFGLDLNDNDEEYLGSIMHLALFHEDGTPPSLVWREGEAWNLTTNTVNSGLEIGSTSLNLTIDTDLTSATDIVLNIFRDTDETINVFSGTIHLASDGSMSPNPDSFPLSQPIQPGDIVVIRLGNLL